uniref:GRAM domain-containing protein n=1 Tax=Hydatigena taeniaeformis TaxID=6205 RepID=A0A0R3XAJ5_HYDTA
LGRMYITEKWICFYSKIIYELKLHISVDDVQTVSKAKTARLIPNAIQITLKSNNERYFFTSFASRERTFAILKKVCENSRNGGVSSSNFLVYESSFVVGTCRDSFKFVGSKILFRVIKGQFYLDNWSVTCSDLLSLLMQITSAYGL